MKTIKTIITMLGLFYYSITFASPHYSNLTVTILNNSPDDYLFLNAEKNDLNAQRIVNYPKPAKALTITANAFTAERSLTELSLGSAPEGNFSYENQHDGSTCAFSFNSEGVRLLNDNNHCSVTNEKVSTIFGVPYQWNSVLTIS